MQNLYKIKSKEKGLIKLTLNNVQKKIVDSIENQKPIRNFTLKARQQGVSTFWLIFWLDHTIFHRGQNTGILAHKRESLGYLMEIVHLAVQSMPESLRPKIGDNNKSSISFPDINSKMFCSLSIRSVGLHNLHISEWAFIKDGEIQATLGACNPRTTNITGETTGNGIGNDAYELYQSAKKGLSEYRVNFFPWFIQEEYALDCPSPLTLSHEEKSFARTAKTEYEIDISDKQILWRRNTKANLKALFPQEYPETDQDAFLVSGSNVFDHKKILRLYQEIREYEKDPGFYKQEEDETWFEKPSEQFHYVAGADPANDGGDYSVLKIINVTKRREAFVFRARCGIDHFYRICASRCRAFNNALLAVERNNHGHAVLLGLSENENYPNLYSQETTTRILGNIKQKKSFGWLTTRDSKHLMIDSLKEALEGDSTEDEDHFRPEIFWYDKNLMSEALTFVRDAGKLEAISGKHDDTVIATAIAFQMYLKQRVREIKEIENQDKLILIGSQREARV